jgi:hypothetical protein
VSYQKRQATEQTKNASQVDQHPAPDEFPQQSAECFGFGQQGNPDKKKVGPKSLATKSDVCMWRSGFVALGSALSACHLGLHPDPHPILHPHHGTNRRPSLRPSNIPSRNSLAVRPRSPVPAHSRSRDRRRSQTARATPPLRRQREGRGEAETSSLSWLRQQAEASIC